MAKVQYVVNETIEQAAKRERDWQKEKAILLRLMDDPQVQEIADHFVKLGRFPEEREVFYYVKLFGMNYKDWSMKQFKITIRLLQAVALLLLIGNLFLPQAKEECLVGVAVVCWGFSTKILFKELLSKRLNRIEMAVCLLVKERFTQTPPTSRP